ncbi:MAG: DinB family protein [Dehalococcoidia bacterium]
MSQSAPTTRDQATAVLDSTRAELRRAIDGLTPEQMTATAVDGWSVKDMISHISSWDELMALDFRRLARGHQPGLMHFAPDRTDSWNEATMAMRREFPLDQVLAELDATRQEMAAALDALPDAAFAAGFVPAVLGVCGRHDEEHSELIEKWRKEGGI